MIDINKKLIIPTVVAVTALVAGFVAIQPIQQASAIHTTVLSNTLQIRTFTPAAPLDVDNDDDIIVDCDVPFAVVSLILSEATNVDAGDDFEIEQIDLENGADDIELLDADGSITDTATADGSLDGSAIEYFGELTNAELHPMLGVISDGKAVEFRILAEGVEADETLDVEAGVYTTNQANCSVTGGTAGD